jgi:hypothetical protein
MEGGGSHSITDSVEDKRGRQSTGTKEKLQKRWDERTAEPKMATDL